MAYRTFATPGAALPPESESRSILAESPFGPLERQVLALAAADPPDSVRPPGPVARLFERGFGIARPNRLADPRLEALRRFAVLARDSRGRLPDEEVSHFLDAGFTGPQARTLLRGAGRQAR